MMMMIMKIGAFVTVETWRPGSLILKSVSEKGRAGCSGFVLDCHSKR